MGTWMKLLGILQISAPSCFLPKGSGVGLWLPGASWGDSIRASQAWNQSLTPIKGCPAPPLWLSHLGLSTLSTFISMNYMWLRVLACVCAIFVCFLAYEYESNGIKIIKAYGKRNHQQFWMQGGGGKVARLSIHHASMLLYTCSQPSTTCLSCAASSVELVFLCGGLSPLAPVWLVSWSPVCPLSAER